MDKILLCLEHKQNRDLLNNLLSKRYKVQVAGRGKLPADFDLCILDGLSLDKLRAQVEKRKSEEELFLPFLLITSLKDVGFITQHLWRSIDEIIKTPIEKIELLARIEVLLKARRLSREAQERYYTLASLSPVGVFIMEEGNILWANPAFQKILGEYGEKACSIPFLDTVHPEDKDKVSKYLRIKKTRGKQPPPCQVRTQTQGGMRSLVLSAVPITYREGQALLGCVTDITEQKKAQEALKRSEKEYRNLVENAHEVILMIQDAVIKFANKKAEEIGGYTREELSSVPFTEFVHPADREMVRQNYFGRLRGEKVPPVYSFRIITKDGDTRWLEISAVKINWWGEPATLNFLTDVTQRKKAQQELEGSLSRLRKALSGCVQVIRSTVEKKDPYTGEHQQRVADLARVIATEMKLSKDRIEGIRTTASIHDIGKIMIPAEILSKPTQLTNLEFSMIKRHPEIGYEILKDIDFPWPVAKIMLQHHERLDGSGYPHRLKGDEIMLEAKILAVADVVEAISSHRPYRPAHSLKDALGEIEKNKGRLYDARVVDTCVKIFRESRFQFK